ncbi:MAG: ATP-dependent RecD-like DNA helicase [Opitutales bacterium]|nr:ATP-dependent RecD-like DNA helicase [Opitutales bacterium]
MLLKQPIFLPQTSTNDTLTGVLERIKYSNDEDGYLIADLRPEKATETVVIVGKFPGVQCGETLRIQGNWTRHPAHGAQFKGTRFESKLPASIYGIRKYLGSGLVKGVSKGIADRIVKHFGEDTLRIISEESARLQEVGGIGKQRARSIKVAWDEQSHIRDLSLFLAPYGVNPTQILKIYKEFGFVAVDLIKENPFKLARSIKGIGFKTCDRIGINMGIGNDSAQRVDAGIEFVMQELQDEGHTAFPERDLANAAAEKLEIDQDIARTGLERVLENKLLKRFVHNDDTAYSQLPYNFTAEENIAASVKRLIDSDSGLPPIKRDLAVAWAQEKAGFEFGDLQKVAIDKALANKVSILTGGPGTGKTTILRAVVAILKAKKARVLLAAPTGRAAQRLSETTRAFGQTIHRLLKFDPAEGSFTVNENKPLNADVIIVDEASMLDTRLASSLFQAIPTKAHFILVGDIDQLPSVGAGNVLKDLIHSKRIPVTRLDVVFRQTKYSSIVHYAHAINQGQVSLPTPVNDARELVKNKDFQFVAASDQEDCATKTLDVFRVFVRETLNLDPINDAQALAPMHKGGAGVGNLNEILQENLNRSQESMPFRYLKFKPGDKIIQTRNSYDKGVFNGDIGIIESIDGANGTVEVDFDGLSVSYEKADLLDLKLAYAISIHKSQGSEYPVVVIPILKAHFMMLQRNLIYTAITRGKKKVVIIGDPAAYAMAAKNSDSKQRCTLLKERLTLA